MTDGFKVSSSPIIIIFFILSKRQALTRCSMITLFWENMTVKRRKVLYKKTFVTKTSLGSTSPAITKLQQLLQLLSQLLLLLSQLLQLLSQLLQLLSQLLQLLSQLLQLLSQLLILQRCRISIFPPRARTGRGSAWRPSIGPSPSSSR